MQIVCKDKSQMLSIARAFLLLQLVANYTSHFRKSDLAFLVYQLLSF